MKKTFIIALLTISIIGTLASSALAKPSKVPPPPNPPYQNPVSAAPGQKASWIDSLGNTVISPVENDIYDLDHGYYYVWTVKEDIDPTATITYAELNFNGIYNWQAEENHLFINLLDDYIAKWNNNIGVYAFTDTNSGQADAFNNWPTTDPISRFQMDVYSDPQGDGEPEGYYKYVFDETDLFYLNMFAKNGYFGFGLDPDCHFYNNGVDFRYKTSTIPEPGSVLLFATGLLGAFGARRKQNA